MTAQENGKENFSQPLRVLPSHKIHQYLHFLLTALLGWDPFCNRWEGRIALHLKPKMARGSLPSALLPAPLMDTAVLQIDGRDLSAPAAAPVSDGTAIDQGIGYILMLVALAITYFVH